MKKLHKALLIAAISAGSLNAGSASAAGFIGNTVTCARNGVACSGVSSAVVGTGIEFARPTTFDFTATGIRVTELPGGSYVNPLVYSFTNLTNPFTSFSNLTFSGNTGLTSNKVTLVNGVLSFDLSGANYTSGSTITLDLSQSAVPEPATWAMMLIGFGMIGFAARRRQSVNTSVRFA